MSRDKQNEIHELAKQMSEAISTEVERRYIKDEAKLQALLIENGWRKASDVAEEIFEELDKRLDKICIVANRETEYNSFIGVVQQVFDAVGVVLSELKKKYIGKDTNVTTNTEEGSENGKS